MSDNEDLARAIALSLEDQKQQTREVIDLITDDEDDEETDFQRHLQLALEESQNQAPAVHDVPEEHSETLKRPVWLMDRAKLERERLERQKKYQQQNPSSAGSGTRRSSPDDSSSEDERPAKRPNLASSSGLKQSPPRTSGSSESKPEDQIFWQGEFRQTATRYADPRADGRPTFRLTQVLGEKEELAFAIISSYSLDLPWIYQFFNPSVPVIIVAQPDNGGPPSIKNVLPHWIRTTPHLRGGFGCQHMKFMLLFYKSGRLRVVVSTANLIAYDWRDMENSVWLQDVPLRSVPAQKDPKADDFPATLQYMLIAVNVAPALTAMISDNHPNLPIKSIEELRQRWDWSNVKVHLVPSIAGRHEGWPSVIKSGHPRLMAAVRKMSLRTGKGLKAKTLVLECQGSSLGNFTTQWLNEFHWSARGESAEDWLDDAKKRREKLPYPPIKIVFPTKKAVQDSALGEQGGGTIFCRRKQWSAKTFPRENFYDSRSKGGPVLMHSKMIIAVLRDNPHSSKQSNRVPEDSETEDDSDDEIQIVEPAVGWAYLGSHNFTPSAWGNLSGSSFNPILNITNYEVGVVFPLKDGIEVDRAACWRRPPAKYATGKDEPWMQEESVHHQNL
ncbi:phospholipase D/nuclease [Coprinopsis marcescibilis]|uniref:Phospholipase D/nuclease n=1 Tax=Coprinopsis marcescibilis TaxID=230819 RepID=A0A5C3KFT4_COPMA|nr:phospholipase D/nuclease [Coprinopsis marcescibilis]